MRYFLKCIVTEFTATRPTDVDFHRIKESLVLSENWPAMWKQRAVERTDEFALHIVHHFLGPSKLPTLFAHFSSCRSAQA
jgi:hypothetical protein